MSDSDTEQTALTESEMEEWKELVHTPHEDLSDKEIASKIRLSMKRKYSAPEWVLVFELTGANGRRADAIAVNTFPSRNFKILGFEFKASRNDWLAEKRNGVKADYFVKAVDEWYVVAGRRGIVEEEELPEGWGLLELKDNRDDQLWTLVESNLTEYQQGEPDKAFWGRFLQKSVGEDTEFTTADIKEARSRGYQEAKDEGVAHTEREIERLRDKAESWDTLRDTGFPLYSFDEEDAEQLKAARAVHEAIYNSNFGSFESNIDKFRRSAERHVEDIEENLDGLENALELLREDFLEAEDNGEDDE